MLMNGQYGAMSPLSGYIETRNALSGMMDNYNRMKVGQMLAQNYPNVLQQQNTAANLANQTSQTNLNYLAPYLSARNDIENTNLNYLAPYLAARNLNTNLSNQTQTINQQILRQKLLQAQNPLANLQSPMGVALSDQAQIHRIYGDGSPEALEADAYVQKLNATKAASTGTPAMVRLPNGAIVPATSQNAAPMTPLAAPLTTPLPAQTNVAPNAATVAQSAATQGSVVPAAPNMPAVAEQQAPVAQQAATTQQGQPVQASMIGQSPNKAGGGVVYYNPATDTSISTPTRATISNTQAQLSALGVARANIQDLYQTISPELGGIGGAKRRAAGAIGQYLNQSDPTYEKYLAAERNIPTTVDNVMKAMGLPKTNEVYQDLEEVMTPSGFGTKSAYLRSIAETLADLTLKDKTNNALLSQGFDLSGNKKLPSQSEIADKIYNELSATSNSAATTSASTTVDQYGHTNADYDAIGKKYGLAGSIIKQRFYAVQAAKQSGVTQ